MNCGRSSSVEWKLPKLQRRVRFPSPAPLPAWPSAGRFCYASSLRERQFRVIGRCVLLEGGGLPRSPSAPRALLGASARSSAKPSHNTCGLPPTNTFRPITLVLWHPYSVISHVIPLRLLQTLNLHRWNCNVFPRSRKITVLNYVRNLSGPGLPSPAVIAAKPYNNTWD